MQPSKIRIVVTLCVLLACGTVAQARGPSVAWASNKATLALADVVVAELGLTEDQQQAIGELVKPKRRSGGGRQRYRDMTEAEREQVRNQRRQAYDEMIARRDDALAGILSPDQMKRLNQISLQARGARALLDEEIQKELGLTDEICNELRATANRAREEKRGKMLELFRSDKDRREVRASLLQLRKELDQEVLEVLSEGDQQRFSDLQGEKLDLDNAVLGLGFLRHGYRGTAGAE